jgi:hypothetical protein
MDLMINFHLFKKLEKKCVRGNEKEEEEEKEKKEENSRRAT